MISLEELSPAVQSRVRRKSHPAITITRLEIVYFSHQHIPAFITLSKSEQDARETGRESHTL